MKGRGSGNDKRPTSGTYIFPSHPGEVDRLDIQHYVLREMLGANYLAPVHSPARVLDVGSGTGQWAYELCVEFPDALVVGLDLASSKPEPPPNYRLVKANVLQGLPIADRRFDFVHQRLLAVSAVPVKSWTSLLRELVRVTCPSGWIELVEGSLDIEPSGPATRRLTGFAQRLSRSMGLDTTGIVTRALDEHLRREGMVGVERRDVRVPIGEWGGRIGSFMASDFRAVYTRLSAVIQSKFDLSPEECKQLITTAQLELEEYHSTGNVFIAVGRKPEQPGEAR